MLIFPAAFKGDVLVFFEPPEMRNPSFNIYIPGEYRLDLEDQRRSNDGSYA